MLQLQVHLFPNTHTWQMPTNLASGQSTNGYFPDLDPTNLDVVVYIAEGPGENYYWFSS